MNKETKLRIHNITAKAALKFGSEAWVLKKREEQRLEEFINKPLLLHPVGFSTLPSTIMMHGQTNIKSTSN